MFNINHYKGKKFSNDEKIDFKIKAIFLLFDKNVDELKMDYHQSQRLIDLWISKLIIYEEYEIAEAFKVRKNLMRKKWRKTHRSSSLKLLLRLFRRRIYKLFHK
jgi:hypothetical protein